MAVYLSVGIYAILLLLIDRSESRPSAVEWLLLLLTVLPVVYTGEWLSGGVLRYALLSILYARSLPFRTRWWRVFYYSMICIVFAITAVVVFEWVASGAQALRP